MAIYHMFRGAPFGSELIQIMSSVFDEVSLELGLAASRDPIRDLVANAILDCASQGIHDRASMRDCAHKVLGRGRPESVLG